MASVLTRFVNASAPIPSPRLQPHPLKTSRISPLGCLALPFPCPRALREERYLSAAENNVTCTMQPRRRGVDGMAYASRINLAAFTAIKVDWPFVTARNAWTSI